MENVKVAEVCLNNTYKSTGANNAGELVIKQANIYDPSGYGVIGVDNKKYNGSSETQFTAYPYGKDNDENTKHTLMYFNVFKDNSNRKDTVSKINSHRVTFDCTIGCENIVPENTSDGDYFIGYPNKRFGESHIKTMNSNNIKTRYLCGDSSTGELKIYGDNEATYHLVLNHEGYLTPSSASAIDLGTNALPFNVLYAKNVYQTSDARAKENIKYLNKNTSEKFADFIRDDLKLTTYNFKSEENKKDTQKNQVGFIAQDMLDTEIGKLIINEEGETLTYSLSNYVNVLAGALQGALSKIEEYGKEIEELKLKIK